MPTVEFRPFMLESAYDYLATVLTSTHKRGYIQEVIGALAIEIVLKSFVVRVNGHPGEPDERYEVDKSNFLGKPGDLHNLKYLAQSLHPVVRSYLLSATDELEIEEHQDTFKKVATSTSAPLRLGHPMICIAWQRN
ncbi:MAG: hypothetical protein ACLGJD_22315 [Gammaproteobacteria bacterium]